MVGIVIAAHGELGTCFRKTVNLFLKDAKGITSVDLTESSGPEKFVMDLEKAVHEVDSGKGVLIMADLFGGTLPTAHGKLFLQRQTVSVLQGLT